MMSLSSSLCNWFSIGLEREPPLKTNSELIENR